MAKTKIGFIDPNEGILITAKEYIKGDPGPVGPAGKDGYTPIKGVDYFDGKDGKDGAPGKDGKDGEPGPAGPKGADGTMSFNDLTDEQKESLKGDDYVLTDTDKVEIAQLALGLMEAAEGVEF